MGKLRDMATGYQWEKIPNEARVLMLEADVEIEWLQSFINDAFEAHCNLDLDVENVRNNKVASNAS